MPLDVPPPARNLEGPHKPQILNVCDPRPWLSLVSWGCSACPVPFASSHLRRGFRSLLLDVTRPENLSLTRLKAPSAKPVGLTGFRLGSVFRGFLHIARWHWRCSAVSRGAGVPMLAGASRSTPPHVWTTTCSVATSGRAGRSFRSQGHPDWTVPNWSPWRVPPAAARRWKSS
jgi:hypothetical protein